MSLQAIRNVTETNSNEQKRLLERKRNLLVLINAYLIESGYCESAERLQHEAGAVLGKFEVADNVDLNLIMNDFEVTS